MGNVIDFTSRLNKKKQDAGPIKKDKSKEIGHTGSFESEATRFHFLAMVPPAFFVKMDQNRLPFCFPPHPDDTPPPAYA